MNKDRKIYSVPTKAAAIIASAVVFTIVVGCLEVLFWLLEEGIFDMNSYDITVFLSLKAKTYGEGDLLNLVNFLVGARYIVVFAGFLSVILYLILLTFILSVAGHKRGEEGIKRSPIDAIPFDVSTMLYFILFFMAIVFATDASEYSIIARAIITILMYSIAYFIFIAYAINFVINVKAGTIFSDMLFVRGTKAILRLLRNALSSTSSIFKVIIYFGILVFFELVAVLGFNIVQNYTVIWFVFHILIFFISLYVVSSLDKLEEAGKRMASGEVEYRLDTRSLVGDFRILAGYINTIGEGLEEALNERMKSERFKTELITNVSHDIKTPLTSIINYTDLLKKENIENEQVKSYIEVLDRQSNRLKRLITDLIEASKASSGSLKVEFTEFDIGVMLSQAVGEYQDKLEKAGLMIVTKFPENTYLIRADGRHLWRVIDNLLNNISKYAKTDTRVYVELDKADTRTVTTFKNISSAELNISGEELMERFVRGDKSRNTEGSGLGLSIARSMMELMGGELKIFVDGDLFKVELIFEGI